MLRLREYADFGDGLWVIACEDGDDTLATHAEHRNHLKDKHQCNLKKQYQSAVSQMDESFYFSRCR